MTIAPGLTVLVCAGQIQVATGSQRRHGLAVAAQHRRAVGIQPVLADREELGDLAREVQVGYAAGGRVFALRVTIAEAGQVAAMRTPPLAYNALRHFREPSLKCKLSNLLDRSRRH